MKKISIIIPVYNEKNTILKLLEKIAAVNFQAIGFTKEVIIIDDGSTDGTKELLEELNGRYTIIYNNKNLGKGATQRLGIAKASGDWLITQDADLEYDPNDILKLLTVAEQKNAQVVYGSRNLNKDNQPRKYSGYLFAFGGYFVTWVFNLLYWKKITDEPTCYKLIKTELLKTMNLTCRGFEFCPEVSAKIAKRGIKIFEVPINYYPRHKNEGKKIKWRDGLVAIWTLIKYRFKN